MTAMVRNRYRVTRRAPFGVRLWDVAAAAYVGEGIEIDVIAFPDRRSPVRPNRSGIYYARDVPGLRAFELDDDGDNPPAKGPSSSVSGRAGGSRGTVSTVGVRRHSADRWLVRLAKGLELSAAASHSAGHSPVAARAERGLDTDLYRPNTAAG